MKDLHNNVRILRGIDPQAVGTTGAGNGVLSQVIDRQGFESAEFVMSAGTSLATSDTITPIVYESDTTTTGDFTEVADADLLGTEAAAVMSPDQAQKIGYRGNKRYLRLRLWGTGTATCLVAAAVALGHADEAPVDATAG